MATIYKTTGGSGAGCTDYGTRMPLADIELRLGAHTCRYSGTTPPQIAPMTLYPHHIVIEVTGSDSKTRKFPKPGYYHVLDLHGNNVGFLFELAR
jgi:hypothetical protein